MYEYHATIERIDAHAIDSFLEYCSVFKKVYCPQILSCKPIIIELARGLSTLQPMCAISFTNRIHYDHIKKVFGTFCPFHICRHKLEEKIYQNRALHSTVSPNKYFEWHATTDFQDTIIGDLKMPPNTHIARSKLAVHPSASWRIVTCRLFGIRDAQEFCRAIRNIRAVIEQWGLIHKEKFEYCIEDSNDAIDQGWLQEAAVWTGSTGIGEPAPGINPYVGSIIAIPAVE